jgi:hypothetical protein
VKAYPDRLCVYHGEELIARHSRSFERHRDIEDPDHAKALVAQCCRGRKTASFWGWSRNLAGGR